MSFSFNPNQLVQSLTSVDTRMNRALEMYAEDSALRLQNYAREKALWVDRSGHARQRLTGTNKPTGSVQRLVLAHGVDYGLFLEMANERRNSIIPRTISVVGTEEIMPGLRNLLERMG